MTAELCCILSPACECTPKVPTATDNASSHKVQDRSNDRLSCSVVRWMAQPASSRSNLFAECGLNKAETSPHSANSCPWRSCLVESRRCPHADPSSEVAACRQLCRKRRIPARPQHSDTSGCATHRRCLPETHGPQRGGNSLEVQNEHLAVPHVKQPSTKLMKKMSDASANVHPGSGSQGE